MHQNLNGLLSKLSAIQLMIDSISNNVDLFGITVSHLTPSINDSELQITNYNLIRRDRELGQGGGVCVYIRNDLNYQRRHDLECKNIEHIWLEIFITHSKPILVCFLYRPPDTSKYLPINFNSELDNMLSITLSENKETLIAGDLNCDYAKIDCSKDLKDVLKLYNFKQVISKPTRITRISSSLIDIIATTHNEHITKSFVFPNSISDHDLIGIIRRINCKNFTPRKILARS